MRTYVESCLTKGEKIHHQGSVCAWSLLPKILCGVVLLPVWGVGLILLGSAAVEYCATELVITNRRVIAKVGLFRHRSIEMAIHKVESIQINQSIVGRIFNFGAVILSGSGDPKALIPGIKDPHFFRKKLFEAQANMGTR